MFYFIQLCDRIVRNLPGSPCPVCGDLHVIYRLYAQRYGGWL